MSKYPMIILLVATFALVAAGSTVPEYIKVCKRNDPNFEKCIQASIEELKPKLVNGIPELDVPPLDPLDLANLKLDFGTGFHANATELKVSGGKNFELSKLKVDLDQDIYNFTITIPELDIVGRYEIDATIAGIPLKGKGPLTLKANVLSGIATLRGKKVPRNGHTRYWFPGMDLKVDMKSYEIKLVNLFEGDPAIGEATNKLLNDEQAEIKLTLLPAIEKALVGLVLLSANNIAKHFKYEDLYPAS